MAVVLVLVGIVLYLRYKIPNVRKEYENADCISPRNPVSYTHLTLPTKA